MKEVRVKNDDDALVLRWLQYATAEEYDSNPMREGIYRQGDTVEATDGKRVHVAPLPDALANLEVGQAVKLRDGKKLFKSAGRTYPARLVDGAWPPTWQVFPSPHLTPQAMFAVKASRLREALEMPREQRPFGPAVDMVTFKVYGYYDPIILESTWGTYRASVLPMTKPGNWLEGARETDRHHDVADLLKKRYPAIYDELREEIDEKLI